MHVCMYVYMCMHTYVHMIASENQEFVSASC